MLPSPKNKKLAWFSFLTTYEVCQWDTFNVTRRSIPLADILKDTRKWLKKSGLLEERPFYAI